MHSNVAVARALSTAFLADKLEVDGMIDRGARLLGRRWRWLRPLANRLCEAFAGRTHPRRVEVTRFLLNDKGFLRAASRHELRIVDRLRTSSTMTPVSAASAWELPAIRSPGELADWLQITVSELDWFADLWTLEAKRKQGPLSHYHYRLLAKHCGRIRLVEAPKRRLKEIQRRILSGILEHIPPHEAAHGFRRGRSIKTFTSMHTRKHVVLRIDLQDFFPSIPAGRIQALFRTAGYPERVADLLAGLCTNATPLDVWHESAISSAPLHNRGKRWLYAKPHLPQGAPTSPALANLCAYRLDCRLSRLADSASAVYTRYADDLAFSGDREFDRVVKRFRLHVAAVAIDEGFAVNHHKTRIMRRGVRQRIAGLVVNDHLNVLRADYDRLKATLTNCICRGVKDQNRTHREDFYAHLLGQVSFVEMVNPGRGRKLRGLLEQIQW